jgi:hypothetical protein
MFDRNLHMLVGCRPELVAGMAVVVNAASIVAKELASIVMVGLESIVQGCIDRSAHCIHSWK